MGSLPRRLGPEAGLAGLLLFYLPLAGSGLLMTLQQPVINAGIARTREPAVQLAAYGVMLSIVVLLESPIQMLLQTATALVVDARSWRLVRQLTFLAGLSLTGLGLLLYVSPLSTVVTDRILGLPSDVGEATRLALWSMLPWPITIAWRRLYQGVLIGAGRGDLVGWATFCRLALIGLAVATSLAFNIPLPGALAGGLALSAGAICEAVAVTWWARPVVRSIVRSSPLAKSENLTFATLLAFYTPLAATSVMTIAVWPIISSALARTSHPNVSLAAWPIALSIWWLLGTPLQMLQQVVIASLKSGTSAAKLARFVLVVGVAASALLAVISFGPLLGSFVTDAMGAPPGLVIPVLAAVRTMVPLPLMAALLALLQGKFIVQGRTHLVRRAMAANIAALALVLFSGTVWKAIEGTLLAAIGLVVSSSVEVSLLHYYTRAPSGRKCCAGVSRALSPADGKADGRSLTRL